MTPEDIRDAGLLACFSFLDFKSVELILRALPIIKDGHKENFIGDQLLVGILTFAVIGSFYFAYDRINEIHLRRVFRT